MSDIEESSLFYISGYLALKDATDKSNLFKNTDFLLLLPWEKLLYSPAELFELCFILFVTMKISRKPALTIYLLVSRKFIEVAIWHTSHIKVF